VASRLRKAAYDFVPVAPSFHRRVREARPALVHAHFAPDGAAVLPLVRRLQVPLIVTLHGYDVLRSDDEISRSVVGRLYLARRTELWARASTFICVSEFMAQKAMSHGFPAEKLQVHYIGVDRTRFAPSEGVREPIALFVGRLVEFKGCEFALRAMQRVAAEVPGVRTVVIGDGPLRGELERLARELSLDCEFLGACDSDTVRKWMARARLLCAPSVTTALGATEALGIVSLEAQASGTPVVGFRSGGIPEAVLEGSTGMLVPPGDVTALAAAMERYFTDEAFWTAANIQSPRWVAERFDLASQTLELERIYDRACGLHT